MLQAVIKIGTSQYLVQPGQELLVDRSQVDQVLMVIDGDQVYLDQPSLSGAKVVISPQGEVKGDKIRVFKFKAKSRYRKTLGFRPRFTKIKIESISLPKSESPRPRKPREIKS